ncbi:hypothetical protein Tco_1509957 [Tanacetum coccineum]
MRLIQSLPCKELVKNLPKLKFDQHFCDACKIGKQAHASHKAKNTVSMTRCLELLHMDLFGPSVVRGDEGNCYTLVIIMPPKMRTRSFDRPAVESLRGGTGVQVGRGGRGRRPREGNDERVDDLNGQ